MPTITLSNAIPAYQWWPDLVQPAGTANITGETATQLKWTTPTNTIVEMNGIGFTYSAGIPVTGTLTSVVVKTAGGTVLMTIAGLNQPAVDPFNLAFGISPVGSPPATPDGFSFLTFLMNGADTINGSNKGDDIVGGRSAGNDTINGNGGDDFIKGDAGSDTINGGIGYDTLSYQETFFDTSAFRGINANLATRTIIDSWGGTDHYNTIEQLQGSKFADVFLGNASNNIQVMGLRGADTFAMGAGFDEIAYWKDEQFGGNLGIIANLTTGKIIDGFGTTDTVSGVDSIIGTKFADRFTGGAGNDQFLPGQGVDIINGGGGFDQVNFSWINELVGAKVDLRLASGQVRNDGFNHIETLVSIENLDGNTLADTLIGNNSANSISGDRGIDTLSGMGGNDRIAGDAGADILTGGAGADSFFFDKREGNLPWGDRITDFVTHVDHIAIQRTDFAGMDGTLRFHNGASANTAGSSFYFNTVTDKLWWDSNGTTAGGTIVVVATLTGVVSLAAADILLVI